MSDLPIIDAQPKHFAQILDLNEQFVHFLSPLDSDSLRNLIEEAGYFRIVEVDGDVAAFLIAMFPGAKYDSPNYVWFDKQWDDFAYIDRIVVSQRVQGRSMGSRLYDDLAKVALKRGLKRMTCEYNLKPMNEGSAKFHDRYGFREVGVQELQGGKVVSLQAYSLP